MWSHLSIFSFQMLCFHGKIGGRQDVPVLQLQLQKPALSLKHSRHRHIFPAGSAVGEQDHSKNNHNRILASQCYRLFPQLKCSGFQSSNLETEITVFIFILSSLQKGSAGHFNQQCRMMQADTENKSVFVASSPVFQNFCG